MNPEGTLTGGLGPGLRFIEPPFTARRDPSTQQCPAASALAGAAIGGIASYVAIAQQIDAQAEQEQSNFLRDERRAAYGAVLTQHQLLEDLELEISVGAEDDTLAPFEVDNLSDRARSTTGAMNVASLTVELIGSDACRGSGCGT